MVNVGRHGAIDIAEYKQALIGGMVEWAFFHGLNIGNPRLGEGFRVVQIGAMGQCGLAGLSCVLGFDGFVTCLIHVCDGFYKCPIAIF